MSSFELLKGTGNIFNPKISADRHMDKGSTSTSPIAPTIISGYGQISLAEMLYIFSNFEKSRKIWLFNETKFFSAELFKMAYVLLGRL